MRRLDATMSDGLRVGRIYFQRRGPTSNHSCRSIALTARARVLVVGGPVLPIDLSHPTHLGLRARIPLPWEYTRTIVAIGRFGT